MSQNKLIAQTTQLYRLQLDHATQQVPVFSQLGETVLSVMNKN